MKKIGIITLNGYDNFGNQLQLYAMQQILSEYGDVKNIIWYDTCEDQTSKVWKDRIKHIIRLILAPYYTKFGKYKRFYKENKKLIKTYNKVVYKEKHFKKLNKKFDIFVAGSDQIWNPNFRENNNMYVNMLAFTSPEKKLAVSPSIGVEELDEKQTEMFVKYLKDFDNLSCREMQGANLLEDITGKTVMHLIDPTLMLSSVDWSKYSQKPTFHNDKEKYIFTYLLGKANAYYLYIINIIAKEHGYKVVNLMDKESIYYQCTPTEFVYLIKNCEIVCTDSFHASVFAYIFDKPLKIFKRQDSHKSMNSRLVSLMKILNLDDNVYYKEGQSFDNLFVVDYDKSRLMQEQVKFKNYLDEKLKEK